jgi:hypothetical protein
MLPALAWKLSGESCSRRRPEGEFFELFATSIIEDVDVELVCRPVDIQRAECGVANDFKRLVVGRYEHVDVRPLFRLSGSGMGARRSGQMV